MSSSYQRKVLLKAVRVADLAAVCFAFVAALAISTGSFGWPSLSHVFLIRIQVVNIVLFMGYLACCSAVFSGCGFYQSHRLSRWSQRIGEVLKAVTLLTGILIVLRWPFQFSFATNSFLLVFWILAFCALTLSREIGQRLLHFARLYGRNLRNVVIIGEGLTALTLADRFTKEASLGYRVLRVIDVEELQANDQAASDI